MLLTELEREFLAAFIAEATNDPFKGPATEALHRRNIYYTDLPHLLTAYYQEKPAGPEGFGGKLNPVPPPCPWKDHETAVRRDREVETELRIRKAVILPEDKVPFTEERRSPLSDEDRDFLLSLLAAPPKANAALKKAARKQRRRHG
jgi:hypothetical protein